MRRALATLVAAIALLAAGAPPALADPIAEFPPPTAGRVDQLARGADGTIWYSQHVDEQNMRIVNVDAAGRVLGSSTVHGNSMNAQLAPATDGGVWVRTVRVTLDPAPLHIAPGGAITLVDWRSGLTEPNAPWDLGDQAVGADGRLWMTACRGPRCSILAAANDGAITNYGALTDDRYAEQLLPVAGGVWVANVTGVGPVGGDPFLAFVSYAGEIRRLPGIYGATLIAPAVGNTVWIRRGALPALTFAEVSTDGRVYSERTLNFPAQDVVHTAPGRDGALVWTREIRDPSAVGTLDGALGVFADGADWTFAVPDRSTAVVWRPDGSEWGGTCYFGSMSIYAARDGGVWVSSHGLPGRMFYRSPAGRTANFRRPSQVAVGPDGRYLSGETRAFTESSDGALWAIGENGDLGSPNITQTLIRANPVSPPAGEPTIGSSTRPTTDSRRAGDMRRRAPRIAGRRALRRLGHGLRSKARRARLRVAVPAAGRLIARVRIRRGRKHVLVASGHVRARRRGTVRLTVRTTRAGRRLLTRHGHKRRASIRLTFQPSRGRPAKIVVARRI